MPERSQQLIRRGGGSRSGHGARRASGQAGNGANDPASAPSKGVRLQRFMADAGVASRRDCEKLIEEGRVSVNGQPVERLPVFIDPESDHVVVDGRGLERGASQDRVYLMLNKPARTLGTTRDVESVGRGGRRTVLDMIDHPARARLFPVGRLGFHDTGLVLLTNDGMLADRLTHARYGVTKTYRVVVRGGVGASTLDTLRRRVGLRRGESDDPAPKPHVPAIEDAEPVRDDRGVVVSGAPGRDTVIELTVREGASQRLAQVLSELGCQVKLMSRVAIGPLVLRAVGPGEWRPLERDELHELMESVGLRGPQTSSKHKAPRRSSAGKPYPPRQKGVGGGKGRKRPA